MNKWIKKSNKRGFENKKSYLKEENRICEIWTLYLCVLLKNHWIIFHDFDRL